MSLKSKQSPNKIAVDAHKFLISEFSKLADADKAVEMAAYMKTDMPFWGIQKPDREPIYRKLAKDFAPADHDEYSLVIRKIWNGKHREEKYAALDYAVRCKKFIHTSMIPLYEELVRDGAWWDLVDPLATLLIGVAFLNDQKTVKPMMKVWIDDNDIWIRRTAILSMNKHKEKTDEKLLYDFCLRRAHEKEFFIRKAIGWALREYSYKAPDSVIKFLKTNRNTLSPLSYREGAKQLVRNGLMKLD
jgi:3-methyladenine DNA glycosylase AlkD